MWTKIRDSVAFLAALGTCWALTTNPGGVLDAVKTKWPTVGDWLAPIGIFLLLLFSLIYAGTLFFAVANAVRSRKESERQAAIASILSDLYEISNLIGTFDPDGTDRARANVILHKLVTDGLVHPQVAELERDHFHKYITALTTTVEKFGLEFAKENSIKLIETYIRRRTTNT